MGAEAVTSSPMRIWAARSNMMSINAQLFCQRRTVCWWTPYKGLICLEIEFAKEYRAI